MSGLIPLAIGFTDPNNSLGTTQLLLRWVHFLAGITWIGLLYFFNLVNAPLMRTLPQDAKLKVFPGLMSRAMGWFRWSAVVTVFMGFAYWNIIVAADAHNARLHAIPAAAKPTVISFVIIWTLAFLVEFVVLMQPVDALKSGPVLGIIIAIVLCGAAYVWLSLNSHAWESSRLQAIGVGGGIGMAGKRDRVHRIGRHRLKAYHPK